MLERVLHRDQPLEETFAGHPQLESLSVRDRAFARLLVVTCLRRLGQIDALLRARLEHWPKETRTRCLLRAGAAQLLFLGTPAHAAVKETVSIAARWPGNPTGLANAVLRKLAVEGAAEVAAQDAARLNTPGWLWKRWSAAYGEPAARTIAEAHLAEPPLDISVKDDPAAWAERLGAAELRNGTLRRPVGGAIETLPGYDEGAWWVQDVAASLPVRVLGDVRDKSVLDLCAAPGGKTAQLAAAGARVVAVELATERAARLRANLRRLKLADRVEIVVADALDWPWSLPFDAVLLDAPCSATGTIRRHPDVAWHKSPQLVAEMAAVQGRLIRRSADLVAPGGALVYASCSLEPEEGPEVVAGLIGERAEMARDAITADELGGLPLTPSADGELRTLPSDLAEQGGMDGFYVARLRRTA